jgi:uncharacterized membrane protein YeaQ/YmgE (transglycosylase-associated protein family)
MRKRFAALLALGLLLCLAFASLLLADGAIAPFQITTHTPSSHEIGVPLKPNIQATLDDDVDVLTLLNDAFVVHGHLGGLAAGSFAYDPFTRELTLDPHRGFHAGEVLRVSATSGILSAGGTPLTPYGWQFTAGPVTARTFAGFVDIGAALAGVGYSSAAWGDYDNDGDLDILLTGSSAGIRVSKVYRNDGGGAFSDINAPLTGVMRSSVAWGDYDNDGDLDILLAGATGGYPITNPVSKIYRNDGAGTFTDIGAALVAVDECSLAWGDYDNDGDLDILLTGLAGAPTSQVYRNDGAGAFTDIGAGLSGVWLGSAAWGDYDNDSDLDILLTGATTSTSPYAPVSKVYRNDGGSAFTDIGAGLTGVREGSVAAWGDCDNDGDLDVLLTGWTGSAFVSKVYRNNSRPELARVRPYKGSGPVGLRTTFETAWGDPDGFADLKQCYFHIGATPALAGNVTLLYLARKNKLWMLDDTGTTWTGGHAPGSLNVLANSQASVLCEFTTVQRVGRRLSVSWTIVFNAGFEGTKKLGLKARDIYKKAKGGWKGTYTITP